MRLFDEEKKLKVSFDLNDKNKSDIKEIDGNLLVGGEDGGNTKITTEVTFYGEDGKPSGDKRKLTFGAYVDKKSVVHLVLDGLDLAADSWTGESKKDTDEGELDETYSIKRLGLDTGKKIYAAVQASGANYKPSAWKNSNSENPYFADSSQTDSEFAVKNARHLFNIRYREGENTVSRYLQKESFAWGGEDGILAAKHVYENGKIVEWSEENVKAFAAVPKLNAGSVYEGSGKKEIAIQELVLGKDLTQESEAGNGGEEQSGSGDSTDAGKNGGTDNGGIAGKAGTGGNEEVTEDITEGGEEDTADPEKTPYGNLGLFCENDGTIRNIVLEHVTVDNAAEVPEENGENVGEEKNGGEKEIAKRESTGLEGALKEGSGPEDTTDLQEAEAEKYGTGALCGVNRGLIEKVTVKGGSVAGNANVGGIAGKDEALKETSDEALGTVRSYAQLENTARVSGNKNVGGILGYNDGSTLTKCVSAPEMEEADLAELEENIEENLRGTNVGGIVGYSQGGALEECATTGGYVTGKSHVGGIVGLMEVMGGPAGDAADGSEAKAAAADGEGKAAGGEGENISLAVLDGSGLKNRAVVIGEEYVGGITGENQGCLIKNWTNEGLVAASKQYAGGITGYNGETGKIENCRTDVDTSAISGEKQLAGVLQGVITQTLIPDPARMGRFPATEILIGTDAALNLIRENKCHQMNTIMQSGAALGMHSLNMDLTRLVGEGKITREDAMKYSNNKKELLQYL